MFADSLERVVVSLLVYELSVPVSLYPTIIVRVVHLVAVSHCANPTWSFWGIRCHTAFVIIFLVNTNSTTLATLFYILTLCTVKL